MIGWRAVRRFRSPVPRRRKIGPRATGFELPGFELPGFELPGFEVAGFELPGFEVAVAEGWGPGAMGVEMAADGEAVSVEGRSPPVFRTSLTPVCCNHLSSQWHSDFAKRKRLSQTTPDLGITVPH